MADTLGVSRENARKMNAVPGRSTRILLALRESDSKLEAHCLWPRWNYSASDHKTFKMTLLQTLPFHALHSPGATFQNAKLQIWIFFLLRNEF